MGRSSAKSAQDRELLESDPLFRKACLRLSIPTKIDKPPKTSSARRRQQRIYEVRCLSSWRLTDASKSPGDALEQRSLPPFAVST